MSVLLNLPKSKSLKSFSNNLEIYTLYTKINIKATDNYEDTSQKDFESIMVMIEKYHSIAIRNNPTVVKKLQDYTSNLKGEGYSFKFGVTTLDCFKKHENPVGVLVDTLDGTVLEGGEVNTLNSSINTEIMHTERM